MKDKCVSKLIRSAVLLVIAFLVFSGYALTSNRPPVSAQTANLMKLDISQHQFRAVKFINANIGWLGGSNGYARTADGGASWVETGIILDVGGVRITPFNALVPLSETQIRFAGAGLMGSVYAGWRSRHASEDSLLQSGSDK